MKKPTLVVAMLTIMAIAVVPAIAQLEDPAITPQKTAIEQYPPVTGLCEHVPGEFVVGYESEEAMFAAPQENVVETLPLPPYVYLQLLRFEEIANISDPAEQRNAEEAQRQQLFLSPGWKYVNYNCEEEGLMAPGPAGGDDTVRGTEEGETLYGTGGNDTIWAGGGQDTVFGGEGHDVIHVEGDTSYDYSDTVTCGPGYDTVYVDVGLDWEWDGDGTTDGCENSVPMEGRPVAGNRTDRPSDTN